MVKIVSLLFIVLLILYSNEPFLVGPVLLLNRFTMLTMVTHMNKANAQLSCVILSLSVRPRRYNFHDHLLVCPFVGKKVVRRIMHILMLGFS